jgi:hypothetical protein
MERNPLWIATAGPSGKPLEFATRDEVVEWLSVVCGSESGEVSVARGGASRSWWQRMTGARPAWSVAIFAIEWYRGVATLMFYDDEDDEYRAVDPVSEVATDQEIRKKISHGEPDPVAVKYCIAKDRAFAAVRERLVTGSMPPWLTYDHVQQV